MVEVDGLIAAALADYSTSGGVNGLITTALADYSTTAQVNGLIATAVGGIDLSNYYERAETKSQAEVNSMVSGAIDSLNITQYRTESQVSSSISDALVPYYTASEVDAAIASNSFNAADYFTRTQSDSRHFPNNANPGNAKVFTLVRDSVSIPRQIRGILPRAPLAWSYLFSGTITELRCDAYSRDSPQGTTGLESYFEWHRYRTDLRCLEQDKGRRALRHSGQQSRQSTSASQPENSGGVPANISCQPYG